MSNDTKKYASLNSLKTFKENLDDTFATKTEVDAKADSSHTHSNYVPTSRTVNGKALSSNVTLSASDVGALPNTTSIPDALSDLTSDSTHRTVTDTEKATWNAKSDFSGSYDDLTDKPTIPSISGLATETYVDDIAGTKVDKVSGKGLSTNDYTTAEKNKLSGISSGAEVNQNAFSNVIVGSTTIAADSKTDSLTIAAGTGISVSGDAANDKVTISNSGVRSITTGSSNGTISVNTNGTSADVAVKGLGSAAYTASSAYDSAGTAQTKADSALSSAKSYTDTKISNLINSAPTTLDTLGEIATAMEENADVVEALEAAIGTKANASHNHSASNITSGTISTDRLPSGSTSAKGVVQLTDSTSSTSTTTAATPKNVKAAYDLANTAKSAAATAQATADGKANASHTHTVANISDLTATAKELNYMDGVTSNVQTQLDSKAASSHNHAASNITSGTLSSDRLPTVPISKGGTGATTAAGALTNLGITATAAELNIMDGVTATASEINKLDGLTATTTELNYVDGVTSNIQTQLNGKLGKTTYEYNKELALGSTGKVCIGKFPMYDSNISVEIKSTTSTTYNGTLVIATQNINTTGGGTYTATVYGDASNTLTDSIKIKYASGSNVFEVYIDLPTWSKNLLHIQCVSLAGSPTDIATTVTEIPSTATIIPTNALKSQLDAKQATITGGATTITGSNLTANRALISNGSGKVAVSAVTSTELGYLDGATSNIQTQLNGKVTAVSGKGLSTNDFTADYKSKLDGITSSADSVSFSRSLTSGTKVGTITINGSGTDLYAPTNTDTHYTTGLKVGSSATATANAAATNGSVYLNVLDNSTVRDSHKIVGSGATTVTSDANGVITISSTDNNTTYSAAGSSLGLVKSGGDVTISSGTITVNDDSHNHVISNVDGLQAALDGKLSTSGNAVSATTASKLGSSTLGSATQPIYLSSGTATKCSTYAGGTAVTLNGSGKGGSTASFYAPTSAGTSGYVLKSSGSGAPTWVAPSSLTIPASSIECNGNLKTVAPTTDEGDLDGGQILLGNCNADGIHAVNGLSYINSTGLQVPLGLNVSGNAFVSGTLTVSGTINGTATSANKLDTNAGSATNPVYFSNGIPVKTTYTLGKSVPSDAKFTDTTYSEATTSTAGLMSSSDKKLMDSVRDKTYVADVANIADRALTANYATCAYADEGGNNIADTYVPRYTPYKRAYSNQIIGTVNGSTFTTNGYNCLVIYKRLSPKSGVLSLNFTMPSNSESSCYGFISLNNICSALGITYAGGTSTDNGHWLCPQKTNLYGYGTACRILQINSIGHYVIQLGRYYDTSNDVGAWAKSNFSGSNVQVMDVYIQEA